MNKFGYFPIAVQKQIFRLAVKDQTEALTLLKNPAIPIWEQKGLHDDVAVNTWIINELEGYCGNEVTEEAV